MGARDTEKALKSGRKIMDQISVFMINFAYAMDSYVTTLDAYSSIDIAAARGLTKWICDKGGFCDAINKIVVALNNLKDLVDKNIEEIMKGIKPIFDVLKNFIDVIKYYSEMKYPTEWNEKGEPTNYEKFTDTMFINASDAISSSFATFLTRLNFSLMFITPKTLEVLE